MLWHCSLCAAPRRAMEAAAIIAIALLDWADFALILALLLLNATISFVEESSAVRTQGSPLAAHACCPPVVPVLGPLGPLSTGNSVRPCMRL